METLLQAFKAISWWAYVLFAYLLSIGIRALKPHILSVRKLFILPLVFLIWSIYRAISGFEGWSDLLFWALAIVGGFLIGCQFAVPTKKLRADRKKLLAYIPGSPLVLVLTLAVFVVTYVSGYYRATHETVIDLIHLVDILASGGVAGLFIGRVYGLAQVFSKAKHENLRKGGNPRKKSLL